MRASRLLRLLLLLQNRGRMNCAELAVELEVARRTVLRDLDALAEAGLPVVVTRGARGGVELGFNYRSRLTGLSSAEAEALGVVLSARPAMLEAIGLADAGKAARTKLLESLPDGVREKAALAATRFRSAAQRPPAFDPRVAPLAMAVREQRKVRIRGPQGTPRTLHPIALMYGPGGWLIDDALGTPVPLATCGSINISALRFTPSP
jgi:predicted DNA-binding transcriptional regulator YafY